MMISKMVWEVTWTRAHQGRNLYSSAPALHQSCPPSPPLNHHHHHHHLHHDHDHHQQQKHHHNDIHITSNLTPFSPHEASSESIPGSIAKPLKSTVYFLGKLNSSSFFFIQFFWSSAVLSPKKTFVFWSSFNSPLTQVKWSANPTPWPVFRGQFTCSCQIDKVCSGWTGM